MATRQAGTAHPVSRDGRPAWDREGADWPNRDASRFLDAAGFRWHVQIAGSGPALLLVHGTGAATHSWRSLLPLLAERFTVVAPDLPGHGFTAAPPRERLSLPGIATAMGELLERLDVEPALAAGHSAGAAVVVRMTLDGLIAPQELISLNGALLPLPGLAGVYYSPLAKLLSTTSLAPRLFAWQAVPSAVARLLHSTGSTLEPGGVELYARLFRCWGHAASTLDMMAGWDVHPLARDLPRLSTPLMLVVGGRDRTVPPREARRVLEHLPSAELVTLAGLGHLAHEERPDEIAELLLRTARRAGLF